MRQLYRRVDLRRDASGAVYGTIVTAGTMVAAAEGVHVEWEIAVTVLVTLVTYVVAHAYSEVLGAPEGRRPSWAALLHELAAESTMLTACVVPLAVMGIASLLGAGLGLAVSAAVYSAVAMLFAWGFVAAGKVHGGTGMRVLSAAVYGLVGVVIVGLRVVTAH